MPAETLRETAGQMQRSLPAVTDGICRISPAETVPWREIKQEIRIKRKTDSAVSQAEILYPKILPAETAKMPADSDLSEASRGNLTGLIIRVHPSIHSVIILLRRAGLSALRGEHRGSVQRREVLLSVLPEEESLLSALLQEIPFSVPAETTTIPVR